MYGARRASLALGVAHSTGAEDTPAVTQDDDLQQRALTRAHFLRATLVPVPLLLSPLRQRAAAVRLCSSAATQAWLVSRNGQACRVEKERANGLQ